MVLIVNDQPPFKSLQEFIDAAKAKPNDLIFSSSGLHGALHLPTALFMRRPASRCATCRPTAAARRSPR